MRVCELVEMLGEMPADVAVCVFDRASGADLEIEAVTNDGTIYIEVSTLGETE